MSTQFIIQTLFEIVLLAAVILSFLKEEKLIAFEEKLAKKFRSRKSGGRVVIIPAKERGAHCA